MTIKSMLLVGVLCLSSLPLANAKSYAIRLTEPSVIGSTQLPAGDYKVKVEGTNAVLTNLDKDKTYTATVKIDTEDRKFDQNAVITDKSNGANHLKSIEVGGSKTRLEFVE